MMPDAVLTGADPLVLDGGLAKELEARGHDLSGALRSFSSRFSRSTAAIPS